MLLFRFWHKGNHSLDQKRGVPLQKRTNNVVFWIPCTRIETKTSSLGLKCKQKHDLLLGVVYPFKLRELRYKEGKLTENYEEKMGITSLWPWHLIQGHQFREDSSQCSKQPFSENCAQIGSFVRLEFCSQAEPDRHTDKLQWKYNPSTISWRCKYFVTTSDLLLINYMYILHLFVWLVSWVGRASNSGSKGLGFDSLHLCFWVLSLKRIIRLHFLTLPRCKWVSCSFTCLGFDSRRLVTSWSWIGLLMNPVVTPVH